MTTLTQFTPQVNQNFAFGPTLDGQLYTGVVTWSLFGQRWVLNIYTLQGVLVFERPLVASPPSYDINLAAGYFSSSIVYRASSNNIEVSP